MTAAWPHLHSERRGLNVGGVYGAVIMEKASEFEDLSTGKCRYGVGQSVVQMPKVKMLKIRRKVMKFVGKARSI